MNKTELRLFLALALTLLWVFAVAFPISAKESAHPNFYISASAMLVHSDLIAVKGTSNLPTGAVLTVYVNDNRSKTFNDEVTALVDKSGRFEANIAPKNGMSLRANLICFIVFSPAYPKQREEVLHRVGRKGELLGFPNNPQAILQTPEYQFLEEKTAVRD